MKPLRRLFDRVAHHFEEDGRWEKAYPLWEALDSFLYTPGTQTTAGPHVRDGNDIKRTMVTVVIALIPCTLFAWFNTGFQEMKALDPSIIGPSDVDWLSAILGGLGTFLPLYIVTLAVGGALETIFAVIRKHEINEGFLVTSLLFPLVLPPTLPLWQAGLGIAFGIVLGKEVFGGTGMNVLNPALTGRIFLYFAYPARMSGDSVWVNSPESWADGYSGATPLARFYSEGGASLENLSWWDSFWGFIPGSLGETCVPACLLGAAILIFSKVGSWRIMLSCFLGMVATTLLFNALTPDSNHYLAIPWEWQLVTGGFAFGAIFMATDPVSASQTQLGMWIYGALIGALTILVRVLNPAYPEGIMLAIIFMNVFAPVIDHYVVRANIRRRERRLGLQ